MSSQIEFVAPEDSVGMRIDRFLAEDQQIGSRSQAARLIDAGQVSVDGMTVAKSHQLAAGQRITVSLATAPIDNSEPSVPFTVAFEDQFLIVVDKPAGLVVHPAPGNRTGTLSQALAGRAGGGDPDRPGIVHRLDKDTSGLLVVAKNDVTLRTLQAELAERRIEREYVALIRGEPRSKSGTIDAPLGRDPRVPEQFVVRSGSSRNAVTHFELIELLPLHALLRIRLETGRTHQIRAHLAAIDLPVSGDQAYGVANDLGLERQFLHAARLAFTHPASGERVEFVSELPVELQVALTRARNLDG